MHSKGDNVEIMIDDQEAKVSEKLFEPLLNRCHIRLEKSMRGSDFIFDRVQLLYYKCHKRNCKRSDHRFS